MLLFLRLYRAINRSLDLKTTTYTHTLIPLVQWVNINLFLLRENKKKQ